MDYDHFVDELTDHIETSREKAERQLVELGVDPALLRDRDAVRGQVREQVRVAVVMTEHEALRISSDHVRVVIAQAFHAANIPYREKGVEHDDDGVEAGFGIQIENFDDFERALDIARRLEALLAGRYVMVYHGLTVQELNARRNAQHTS